MFELMAVDGVPAGELATPEKLDRQMQQLMGMQQQIMSALLAQQQEISKLTAALATVRISRTQELAMREAITARAAWLSRTEDMPSSERRIVGAICKTLREHGAVMAQMTGSGAAVFGIFVDEAEARTAAAALKTRWPQVYVAQPDKGGARVTAPKWML